MGSKSRREFTTHFFFRMASLGNLNSCLPVLVELEQFGAEQPPMFAVYNQTATLDGTVTNVGTIRLRLEFRWKWNHHLLTGF